MSATNHHDTHERLLRLDNPLLKPEQAAELLAVRTSWILRSRAHQPPAVPAHRPAHPLHARNARGMAAGARGVGGESPARFAVSARGRLCDGGEQGGVRSSQPQGDGPGAIVGEDGPREVAPGASAAGAGAERAEVSGVGALGARRTLEASADI